MSAAEPTTAVTDVTAAAVEGVTMIVNNRPDGEDDGQPLAADIEAAACRVKKCEAAHPPAVVNGRQAGKSPRRPGLLDVRP